MGFDFEKLDVYQESLSFADSVYGLTVQNFREMRPMESQRNFEELLYLWQ
jgi:hypothetical protein